LEKTQEYDPEFNTYEWVIIMGYYAMFHSVNALLRKIGVKVGKQYAHDITTNLLLYYFYYTKIIEDELLKIYENAEERFTDTETGHTVAVMRAVLYGKERDIMVAYRHENADVKLLTIHPLKEGQKENRIQSGRWRKI